MISLIPSRLQQLTKLFRLGLVIFLKILKFSEFRSLESSLFHSRMINGKKEFLENLCLIFKREIFSAFLVKTLVLVIAL